MGEAVDVSVVHLSAVVDVFVAEPVGRHVRGVLDWARFETVRHV